LEGDDDEICSRVGLERVIGNTVGGARGSANEGCGTEVTLRTSRPELNRRYFINANDEAINFLNLSDPSLPTDIGNLLLRAIEEHPYYFPPPPARRRNHNELEAWRVSSSACLGVRGCFQLQRCSLKRLLITKNVAIAHRGLGSANVRSRRDRIAPKRRRRPPRDDAAKCRSNCSCH